jgi:ferredoxin
VEVCPVDCIHPKKDAAEFAGVNKLYIDPETCIDCGACVPVCPVQAIFPQEELPEKWANYTRSMPTGTPSASSPPPEVATIGETGAAASSAPRPARHARWRG